MSGLFEGNSDSESEFKCENEYAKNYNQWRKKEELNKLKTKYGDTFDGENSGESSSSEEDEEGAEITEQLEKDFFNTLASLKNRDPKIYDDKFKFFNDADKSTVMTKKGKKEKPMYIMDYERQILMEKGGELSDSDKEEEENPRARSPTYVEEQKQLKESLKNALKDSDDEDDGDFGGLLKARVKTKEEKEIEESDYKKWLLGQKDCLEDETVEQNLKPLKEFWTDPKLDDGEKFLRDYILNKKFLDKEDENYIPTYEEIVHDSDEDLSEDEEHVKNQEEFEHKYNYRFEEPDQEFLKRYPRTVENSLRKNDDTRKVKRQEVKERKLQEKEQKMQDIQKLKELKKQEIEEKIKKLREITGNTEVAFEGRDLDDDFDPDEHDKRMQALFDDEFYEGEEMDQKPEFPELDEELEIERWDKYNPEENRNAEDGDQLPHCEDENFNMDCDYDPMSTQQELIENSKGKKKRKRKSKFAKAISEPKPAFDPNDKTYEEYLDEYYKLDCEDIIGDMPCRFKYRKVVPNSFGLTIDEILRANDRELNRWASLKKATQHRPENMERYDQIAYAKKAQNEALKRKLLPSLYVDENAPSTSGMKSEKSSTNDVKKGKGKKNNKNMKNNQTQEGETNNPELSTVEEMLDVVDKDVTERSNGENTDDINGNVETSKDDSNNKVKTNESTETSKSTEQVNQSKKKKKNKKRKADTSIDANNSNKKLKTDVVNETVNQGKNSNKKLKTDEVNKTGKQVKIGGKNKLKKNKGNQGKKVTEFSDARLQAFGIKPKKFKNKLKYGNKK